MKIEFKPVVDPPPINMVVTFTPEEQAEILRVYKGHTAAPHSLTFRAVLAALESPSHFMKGGGSMRR